MASRYCCQARRLFSFLVLSTAIVFCTRATADPELAGVAVFTDTARDIYLAGILTSDGRPPATRADDLAAPATMELRIATRRISGRGLAGTLLLQAELGAGARAPSGVVDLLSALKRELQGFLVRGDHLQVTLTGTGDTAVVLNGTELLRQPGGEDFRFLLQGWLGENASTLLREPLSRGAIDPSLDARYHALAPNSERRDLVARWVQAPEAEPAGDAPDAIAGAEPGPPDAVEPDAASPAIQAPAAETPVTEAAEPAGTAQGPELAEVDEVVEVAKIARMDIVDQAPGANPVDASPGTKAVSGGEAIASVEAGNSADTAPRAQPSSQASDDRVYQQQLREFMAATLAQVFRHVEYPRRALKRQREGKVELIADVNARGELLGIALGTSSGYDVLDDAAMRAIEDAAPFPALVVAAQEEFRSNDGNRFELPIPVNFHMRQAAN